MSSRGIVPAIGLFFAVGVLLLFGTAILSGISNDVGEAVSEDNRPAYNALVSTIGTTMSLTTFLPYLLILIVVVLALLFIGRVKY